MQITITFLLDADLLDTLGEPSGLLPCDHNSADYRDLSSDHNLL